MATSSLVFSERALAFTVNPDATHPSAGLEALIAHVATTPNARLTPVDGAVASAPTTAKAKDSAKAKSKTAKSKSSTLTGAYVFHAESNATRERFETLLSSDKRVQELYRPPAYRSAPKTHRLILPGSGTPAPWTEALRAKLEAADKVSQWGLARCGFRKVWSDLEQRTNPGLVVMIDNGNRIDHPEIKGLVSRVGPPKNQESIADHAGSVAAIICARRAGGGINGQDMVGCCSAKVRLHNAWTRDHGLDHDILYNALETAIREKVPVVNVSIWLDHPDTKLETLLDRCEKARVVVVAAVGNAVESGQSFYPATHPNVIAVAATDAGDDVLVDSNKGKHVFIAAPGDNILTTVGNADYGRKTGTSFAAPFVTSAVWLMKSRNPNLTNEQVRWLLSKSVQTPNVPRRDDVGFGRLDLTELAANIDKVPPTGVCTKELNKSMPPRHGV
jgi:subtilisin family serine protease